MCVRRWASAITAAQSAGRRLRSRGRAAMRTDEEAPSGLLGVRDCDASGTASEGRLQGCCAAELLRTVAIDVRLYLLCSTSRCSHRGSLVMRLCYVSDHHEGWMGCSHMYARPARNDPLEPARSSSLLRVARAADRLLRTRTTHGCGATATSVLPFAHDVGASGSGGVRPGPPSRMLNDPHAARPETRRLSSTISIGA